MDIIQKALDNGWRLRNIDLDSKMLVRDNYMYDVRDGFSLTINDNTYNYIIPTDIFRPDILHFGFKIPDHRIQIALDIGWYIDKTEDKYLLSPPAHFNMKNVDDKCKIMNCNGYKIMIPYWFEDDNVLVTGKRVKYSIMLEVGVEIEY